MSLEWSGNCELEIWVAEVDETIAGWGAIHANWPGLKCAVLLDRHRGRHGTHYVTRELIAIGDGTVPSLP